ncbi:MAG: hypothetical protein FWD34_07655 [Oscillospiraceae bacterium]|nr:hypothetical protein [Oscillospiraceae bacterium]
MVSYNTFKERMALTQERMSQAVPRSEVMNYDNEGRFIEDKLVDYIINNHEKYEIPRDSLPHVINSTKSKSPFYFLINISIVSAMLIGIGVAFVLFSVSFVGNSEGGIILTLLGLMTVAGGILTLVFQIKKFLFNKEKYNMLMNNDYQAYLLPVTRKKCVIVKHQTSIRHSNDCDIKYHFFLECDCFTFRTYAYSYDRITDKALIVLFRFGNDYAIDIISP